MTRKPYRRSRTDYPPGVIGIYDNGGKTADRYTVVYKPYQARIGTQWFPYVGISGAPFHPQGVCQHGEAPITRPTGAGKVIRFEDLPEDCQKVVRRDLEGFAEQENAL